VTVPTSVAKISCATETFPTKRYSVSSAIANVSNDLLIETTSLLSSFVRFLLKVTNRHNLFPLGRGWQAKRHRRLDSSRTFFFLVARVESDIAAYISIDSTVYVNSIGARLTVGPARGLIPLPCNGLLYSSIFIAQPSPSIEYRLAPTLFVSGVVMRRLGGNDAHRCGCVVKVHVGVGIRFLGVEGQ
jgi:hypothetical protein